MKYFMFFIIQALLIASVFAQDVPAKHPRVAEVEEKISSDVGIYFERLYPKVPFSVTVEAEPLRMKQTDSEQNNLPYFDYDSETNIDPWDDLSVPVSYLRNRLKKVAIVVHLPSDFDESKIESVKQDLLVYLKLAPFRDDIRIERKLTPVTHKIPSHYYYIMGALLFSALVLGAMIKWSAGSVHKNAGSSTQGSASPIPSAQGVAQFSESPSRSYGKRSLDPISLNEVTINDSMKLWDSAQSRIKTIIESGTFPTYSDLNLLHALAEKNPSKLGAILYELPAGSQKNVLKFGKGEIWLEAVSNPGKLDNQCLDILDKMGRKRSYLAASGETEALLIQVWRMDKTAEVFLKSMPQEHSFAILDSLPKSLALPLARKLYPGGWAKLLDRKQISSLPDPDLILNYLERSQDFTPFLNEVMVEQYKKDSEILSYLNAVSIQDEKEVYEVLAEDSFVKKIRKPFFPVFELPAEKFGELVKEIPLETWALVTANSQRSFIKQVLESLDDKRKIIYTGHLKRLDAEHIPVSEVVGAKQQILLFAQNKFPEELIKNNLAENNSTEDELKGRESA